MANIIIGYSCCPLTRAAFQAHGHDVWTCDKLPARDGSEFHLQMDIWKALKEYAWDFAVLHPMCTYLTVSAAWAFADPDFEKWPHRDGYHQKPKPGTLTGLARRKARDKELANFRRLLKLPFPCVIENPGASFINTAIRKPDQLIQPYQCGDDASKLTGFWLTHGAPPMDILPESEWAAPRWVDGKPRWSNQTDSGQSKNPPSDTRWLDRSETFPGVAALMGDFWGRWLNTRAIS